MSDKPTIVLLPGLDGTGRLYQRLIDALAPEARVQAIGYPSERFLGYGELADLVIARAPVEPYAIVAESFSGPVAVRVGARRPAGLRGIILSTSFIVPPVPGWLRAAPLELLFRLGIPGWLLRGLLLGSGSSGDVVAEAAAVVASVPPSLLAARVRERAGWSDRGGSGRFNGSSPPSSASPSTVPTCSSWRGPSNRLPSFTGICDAGSPGPRTPEEVIA